MCGLHHSKGASKTGMMQVKPVTLRFNYNYNDLIALSDLVQSIDACWLKPLGQFGAASRSWARGLLGGATLDRVKVLVSPDHSRSRLAELSAPALAAQGTKHQFLIAQRQVSGGNNAVLENRHGGADGNLLLCPSASGLWYCQRQHHELVRPVYRLSGRRRDFFVVPEDKIISQRTAALYFALNLREKLIKW